MQDIRFARQRKAAFHQRVGQVGDGMGGFNSGAGFTEQPQRRRIMNHDPGIAQYFQAGAMDRLNVIGRKNAKLGLRHGVALFVFYLVGRLNVVL